jgi:RNA polymerase sigma factor (sigma-70 family)
MNEGVFATTHWSVVVSAGKGGSEAAFVALDRLCQAYWYPLFAYVRRRGYAEDQAKDLTQAFFAQLIGRNYLSDANPELGRFRTFLLTSLNHFLANEWSRGHAQKRGGGVEFISLDYAREQEGRSLDPGHELTPERIYEKRWAEAVLEKVLERLRSEFDGVSIKRFDVLKQFLTEEKGASSYANVAQALGMTNQAVKSAVHRLRQRWRELMREEIAHTVHAATSKDVDDEIRYLLNVLG